MPKIIVIGAGLSGLTSAYRLHKKGFDVELYEARGRVGGRVYTVNIRGHLAEMGGQNILDGGDAKNMIRLIQEMGLETEENKSALQFYFVDKGALIDAQEYIKNFPYTHVDLRSKLKEVSKHAKNMADVLQALFYKDSMMYKICSTMLSGYEGGTVEKLSPVYIETLYHLLTGGLSSAHKEQFVDDISYIDHLTVKGGNATLAEKMAHILGKRVHLNHPLKKLEKTKQNRYQLTFQEGLQVQGDIVILAIPCSVYPDIFISDAAIPANKKQKIESIELGTTTKIVVPINPLNAKEAAYSNGRFITFMNRDDHVLNVYYIKEYGKFTKDTVAAVFQKEVPLLEEIYKIEPHLSLSFAQDISFEEHEGPLACSWPNDPFSRGSYSYVGAGQEELFTTIEEMMGEPIKTLFAPIDDTLFFAGEHTSILLDVGGTMEAAVEAGERTARLVEKSIEMK